MTITIALNSECLLNLDLSPVRGAIANLSPDQPFTDPNLSLQFEIDYPRDPSDPRELSEIPEIRLWFIRLDATYPWLPLLLDRKSGEFARYVAMLVPHEFHRTEGIQYNPEALEIFLMNKIFTLANLLQEHGAPSKSKLISLSQMLGYELDDGFFELLGIHA
ncbi:CRR6 family NdhI maturation factor [Laspinema olomoucense]|uniref:CRR6 family NdhI maturation factor n=1 Tax=Laspinema olomoucense D3b TaxID=2953688 RepID=A0ABT2N4G2_9CYAN|nr:CRR6 family NdhI maturation factor [Laspinema sp. D3b]MCT7976665.1 CRR6 family NdhI maturation factor [Laspinema sp. D3b]